MSTITEIENAVDALSQCAGRRKRWPVQPPKVSKTESQRIARRIESEFGRVEWENWK